MSLQWLELFQICAEKGSLQAASQETGLSISTISHHLRNLEEHLGVALLDHSRRPMVLTPKGRVFLRDIEDALYAIRRAKAEASTGTPADTSFLRLGTVEDFDSDIIPELAVYLSQTMPRCDLNFHTDASHSLIDMLKNRQLDLAISTTPTESIRDLLVRPLLRDPFVVVLPANAPETLADIVAGRTKLPLLRFSGNQIIARQIEAQLRRLNIVAARGFECSNNQTLMAMVASGAGWAISTPLLYSRARRFHDKLRIFAFPGKSFSRRLAILASPDCGHSVVELVDMKLRALVTHHAVRPLHAREPWLQETFTLLS